MIASLYYLDQLDWIRCFLPKERHISSLDQQSKMETLLPKVMCQGILDFLFYMSHAQLAVWIPWSVQHLYLQGDFLSPSTHEAVELAAAAQAAPCGH